MRQVKEASDRLPDYVRIGTTVASLFPVPPSAVGRCIFLFAIFLSLLSQGAVNPIVLAVVAGLFGILAFSAQAFLGEPRATKTVFRIAILTALVLVGWVIIQTIPLGRLVSPVWADLGGFVKAQAGTISIAPVESQSAIISLALPFLVFVGALVLFPSDDEAHKLLSYVANLGGILALWAIGEFLFSPGTLFLDKKFYYFDSVTAPFVNRNTAGTFYGLVSILLSARVYIEFRSADFQSMVFNTDVVPGKKRVGMYIALEIILLSVSLVALFLTKSRGGIGATFLAYLVFVPLALYAQTDGGKRGASFRSDWRKPVWRLAKSILGLVAVVIIGMVFADYALFRAEIQGLSDPRFCVAPAILEAANNNKLTGVGFATFRLFFPAYRDPHCGIVGVWDRAHSVYLEGYLGLGAVFWVALAVGLVTLVSVLVGGIAARRSLRVYPIAGLSMLVLVLAHSVIDFSLQIPGFAVVFAAVMAATVTISRGRAFIPPGRG